MAVVYRCDKCHGEYKDPRDVVTISIPYVREVADVKYRAIELCGPCVKNLLKYLEPDAVEAKR